MKFVLIKKGLGTVLALLCQAAFGIPLTNTTDFGTSALGPGEPSASSSDLKQTNQPPERSWNWHVQNTDVVQAYPGFSAKYSGPNSLHPGGEVRETISVDFYAGMRLWHGAEAHVDGLMWQGFGLSRTLGIEAFPNGEAFRLGTDVPNVNFARAFVRQTFNLGGEEEQVQDDTLHLPDTQDISRLTLTLGRMSAKDVFDNNAYANDPRSQFMSWALMANQAWDYPADSLGYINGFTAELNQPHWAVRYGIFQMPKVSNGTALDWNLANAWGMATEVERRFELAGHPGAIRLLAFLNRAHMGSYEEAVDNAVRPADIEATRAYRFKYGFGLNFEQEIVRNIGAFARLGCSDGHTEAWTFSDVDRTATLGMSVAGEAWGRPGDTLGLAGVLNGLSKIHQRFFEAGGTGILAGDGTLTYGWEQSLELYYSFQLTKGLHATFDYQFVSNPAFNRDRGPVSVLAARLHFEF